jgi:hypothetical protein
MEDSDYDYDEYFSKHLIDDTEKEKEKGGDEKKKEIRFTNELDLIISSNIDDSFSSKFSKSLKVSNKTKGKSLTSRKYTSTSNNSYSENQRKNKYNDEYFSDNELTSKRNTSTTPTFENKKEINQKATLAAVLERQKRLEKIKEKSKKKTKSLVMSSGIELLFNVMKLQNIKVLEDVRHEFKSSLPFNIDMEAEFIKPPYLTPKIVSHKLERLLNQT